ncbi:MAG: Ig-like domain-containing protein [Nitrospirota bacterium]|nr:Ig-like domain-containing protein [Nitrospirota bacterium]
MRRFFGFLIILSLFVSCSSEKPADIVKGKSTERKDINVSKTEATPAAAGSVQYLLEITPLDASRSSVLSLTSKGFNLSDAEIEWMVNGNPVIGETAAQFKAIGAKKGDTVQAKAMVKDREISSNIVKVKNAAPELNKIKIMPETFKAGDVLYVDVSGSDIDGDDVTILFEWTKNGEPAGKEKQIGVPIKRGEKISIKITPFDGENYGQPVILHREIRNLPPMIVEHKRFTFDGNVYAYQVNATDPDSDPLTYSLKTAPSGMTIGQSTGLIQWTVPQDFKGKAEVAVVASDNHGGEALQSFVFEMTTGR